MRAVFRFTTPVVLMKEMELPDFTIDNDTLVSTKQMPFGVNFKDRLSVTFSFKRRYGFYILQAYVPTYLTIVVSWIAFVMDTKATAARTSLSISALLALTFQLGNILSNLPRVSYTKALDVWIMGCISFLFGCIAELALVSYYEKQNQKRSELTMRKSTQRQCLLTPVDFGIPGESIARRRKALGITGLEEGYLAEIYDLHRKRRRNWWKDMTENPEQIDKLSLVLFPLSFLLFNVFYWFWYVFRLRYLHYDST